MGEKRIENVNLGYAVRSTIFFKSASSKMKLYERKCTVNFCKVIGCPHLYFIYNRTSKRHMCRVYNKQISKMVLSQVECQREGEINGREES